MRDTQWRREEREMERGREKEGIRQTVSLYVHVHYVYFDLYSFHSEI